MSGAAVLGVLLGAACGLGMLMVWLSLRGERVSLRRLRTGSGSLRWTAEQRQRLVVAAVSAILVGVLTRWLVVAVAVLILGVFWERIFGSSSAGDRAVVQVEALAIWTESLRDTVAGSMSLEQAIPATLDAAPPLVTEPLHRLVALMRARVPMAEALGRFADDLDDASADLVVAALLLNTNLRGPGLEAALTELARNARDELELRQRVEAGRQPLRRAAWAIVAVTLVFVLGLAIFSREYVEPYESVEGQAVLAVVVALFATSFAWARRLSEYSSPPRFLSPGDRDTDRGVVVMGADR